MCYFKQCSKNWGILMSDKQLKIGLEQLQSYFHFNIYLKKIKQLYIIDFLKNKSMLTALFIFMDPKRKVAHN